jgi:two-component system NtrC family sensor kinase
VCFALINYAITQAGFRMGNWRNLVAVGAGILLVGLMLPVRRLMLEGLERFQYRERLGARRALTAFAEEASTHRDPEELLSRLGQLLSDALAVDQVVTYIAQGDRLHPLPAGSALPVIGPGDLRGVFPSEGERPLRERGLWHRFVMERDGSTVGVVYCSRRQGGLPLGHSERRLVAALAAQAALALQNTLLLSDLRHQVEEHRLLENYLERVFQSSAVALLICDDHGRVLRANGRTATLLHRTSSQIVGQPLANLVELSSGWQRRLPDNLAGAQVRFAVGDDVRTGLLSTSALEVEPGKFDGRVVAIDDISEQLRLEQRLAEQERLAALGRLAAGLAHEVNTPVTGIASYAQLLKELTAEQDPRAPLVEKLEEQSFRVSRIVTNLLELARPSGFERQPVDLAAVANDELVQMRGEAERGGVAIRCVGNGGATVGGNRVQLELVVHNLVRNAVQSTPPGGDVEISVASDGSLVVLEVADSGPGIPEEVAAHIFEPFVTTRQGRGGTGLGLAITRDIVRAHGGSIAVARNTAGGTVLRVELPALGRSA